MEGCTDPNKWELQGKEKEMTFNLNRVNFGARVYNPTIGRWDWVDPLAEEYYSYSTFSYTLNNPIIMIDADGNYLGDGGKDDGKVYQLESKYRARFENKNVN
ncbi:RHS repeat-associated core domain-containing protein [Leadbetterella sp. DM7]|uniref:RHS repeat-associated core domain-containing protein n=1 Tax=Leadbetterella sp. DM7 TaxID=3235085 RepID=UPI00349ECA37